MHARTVQPNLTDVFNVLVDAVIAFDHDQRVVFFNSAAAQLFGYAPDAMLGKSLDELIPTRFVHAHHQHFEHFADSRDSSRPMAEREHIFARRQDGREFPAEAAIAKLPRDDDSETLYIVILRDITMRQKAEDDARARAQEIAVAAERSRLARDLHDAVTQTLFSVSLIADVLPRIWERNPDEGHRRIEELRQLSRGALAEMRTLLLELRPSALMEANLSDLLRQLVASVASRSRVSVEIEIHGERVLPPDVKVSLYRIAQEALNNVAKHSNATQARVELTVGPEHDPHSRDYHARLAIIDNGVGFDTAINKPTHIGLDIMRERAAGIDAQLDIQSAVGRGTTVVVEVVHEFVARGDPEWVQRA